MKAKYYLLSILFALVIFSHSNAATYFVTTTADSGPGSLRQAILNANSMVGHDFIHFSIPGSGVRTITPLSELPWITNQITINGFSQVPISNGIPPIQLNGSMTSGAAGLVLSNTNNSTIRGLVINRFSLGIGLVDGSCHHTIQGNYIGTDPTGTIALGNESGLSIHNCSYNQIGVGARNLISGNQVNVSVSESSWNVIQNNYVGLDATGNQVLGYALAGVIFAHSLDNIVRGNVISGNQGGVMLEYSDRTSVLGNYFGTDKTGISPLGDYQTGIYIKTASSNNKIGDISAGDGNIIASSNDGVKVESGTGNSIRGNSIYTTAGTDLGIDLGAAGPTPNDFRDYDSGPNNLQNSPYLSDAVANGSTTLLYGSLGSNFNTQYVIDFYSNSLCGATGFGDGKTYLGSMNVTTWGKLAYVDFLISLPVSVPIGHVVTATATRLASPTDTSEFSNCATVHYPD